MATNTLLTIPKDIRAKILKFALQSQCLIIRCPEDRKIKIMKEKGVKLSPKPTTTDALELRKTTMAILFVNKQIHNEVADYFPSEITISIATSFMISLMFSDRTHLNEVALFQPVTSQVRHLAIAALGPGAAKLMPLIPQLSNLSSLILTFIDERGQWDVPSSFTFGGMGVGKYRVLWTQDKATNVDLFLKRYVHDHARAKAGMAIELLESGNIFDMPLWPFRVYLQSYFLFEKQKDGEEFYDFVTISELNRNKKTISGRPARRVTLCETIGEIQITAKTNSELEVKKDKGPGLASARMPAPRVNLVHVSPPEMHDKPDDSQTQHEKGWVNLGSEVVSSSVDKLAEQTGKVLSLD